jgi:PAS domain S-box-containing protein
MAVVIGTMVLLGWVFDIVVLKSILPGWFPMKANFAVALILIGIALWLITRPPEIPISQSEIFLSRFCMLLAGLIGLLTLGEYSFGWDLGIDQWLFREPVGAVGTSHPGRMAQDAALCLVLLATALLITRKTRWGIRASVSLGLLVATIGLTAMLSHLTPGLGAYGWFGFSIMAMHAAMILVILGVTVIALSWQPDVLQWSLGTRTTAAFVCGMVVLVFIGFNTSRSQFLMKETNRQIAYSEEVKDNALGLLIEVINTKAQARSYFITGDEQFKTRYLEAKANSNVKLDALRKLVADHPHQQQQFARIEASANTAFQWFKQVVDARRTGMADAARNQMIVHGEGLLDNFRETFDQIENEHQQFVEQLKLKSESASRLSYLTIAIGTLASLIIFLIGIFRLNSAVNESKRKEDEYRTVIYTSFDGFCTTDFSGRVLDVNEAYCQMLGYTREEFLRLHVRDFEASESPEETVAHFQKFIRTGSDRFQTRQRRKNGAILDVEASVQYVAALGERIFSFIRDITERKRAEVSLRNSETQLHTIVESLTEGIAVSDIDGQLLHFNRAALDLHGFATLDECRLRLPEFANSFELSAMDGTVWPVEQWPLARVLRGENLRNLDVRIRHIQAGWRRIYSYGGTLVRDADGQPLMGLVTISDITERKKTEEEIRQLNANLEERVHSRTAELEIANKELEGFSYSVSHDLRVPLRAIDGFSRLVLKRYEDKLDADGKRLLNVVRDNTRKMGQLIDDILAFSRAGRLEIRASESDMEVLARDVWQELAPSMAGRDVRLEIKPLPKVQGDAAMLRQVWVNLLGNAAKFTIPKPLASIEVGASITDSECVFYVKDNGAGFDPQYMDKLFGVFQRLHGVAEFEGTGIGLAIVKRIITRHGGRVWAEGNVNEGATFYFALPVLRREQA